jgi:hypothetical protein
MLLAVGLQGCLLPADLAVELVVTPDRAPDRAALYGADRSRRIVASNVSAESPLGHPASLVRTRQASPLMPRRHRPAP